MSSNSVTFHDVVRMVEDPKIHDGGRISGFTDALNDKNLKATVIIQRRDKEGQV